MISAKILRENVAAELSSKADGMQAQIDHKRGPLTQNATPRRLRIKDGQRQDADRLEVVQRALRALANGHQRGDLHGDLVGLRSMAAVGEALSPYGNPSAMQRRRRILLEKLIEAERTEADREADARVARRREIEQAENALRWGDVPGFFPTPRALASQLVTWADIPQDRAVSVLEPSAGIGSIVEAIDDLRPKAEVTCVEVSSACCEVLRLKGYKPYQEDFFEFQTSGEAGPWFDFVLMNPPFERAQDVRHVIHAWKYLKKGGRLVAVMSAGSLDRSELLAEWLDGKDHLIEDVPEGAFTGPGAFRQTSVRCGVLIVDK